MTRCSNPVIVAALMALSAKVAAVASDSLSLFYIYARKRFTESAAIGATGATRSKRRATRAAASLSSLLLFFTLSAAPRRSS